MLVKNKKFGTYPSVIHCTSAKNAAWEKLTKEFFESPQPLTATPEDLTILTWNTKEDKGILERSLDKLGMTYRVMGRGKEGWRNMAKVRLIAEEMKTVETPYVMAMDCYDVIVLRGLSDVVETFEKSGKQMVFSAATGFGGMFTTYELEEAVYKDEHLRHLNTGMMIARTPFCRNFFRVAVESIPWVMRIMASINQKRYRANDQSVTRAVAMMFYPHVALDHRCEMFHNMRKPLPLTVVDDRRAAPTPRRRKGRGRRGRPGAGR